MPPTPSGSARCACTRSEMEILWTIVAAGGETRSAAQAHAAFARAHDRAILGDRGLRGERDSELAILETDIPSTSGSAILAGVS
jgi:hypothetical protein